MVSVTPVPYRGTALTVGGELNKLASNIALGRDTAGVHWRSDGIEGLKVGGAVAMKAKACSSSALPIQNTLTGFVSPSSMAPARLCNGTGTKLEKVAGVRLCQ